MTVAKGADLRSSQLPQDDGPVDVAAAASRTRRMLSAVQRHPLLFVVAMAAAVRALAILLLGPMREGVVVPDEDQYLDLAVYVASGFGAEAFEPGRGQELYDSTAAFMRPLTFLTDVFGSHQALGQLLAGSFGVLTALLTTWLALRVVRPRFALLAGLGVALLPSQVFWSSLVLRESMVWASLAAIAVAVAVAIRHRSWKVLVGCAVVATAGLWALVDLRGLTAVLAGLALVATVATVRAQRRVAVPVGALALAILVPLAAGIGPLGFDFVERAAPQLGVIRTTLSLGADSAFVPTKPAAPKPRTEPAAPMPRAGPIAPKPRTTARPEGIVDGGGGMRYAADEGTGANLSALPRGLVAVTVRPLPWDRSTSLALSMAKIENLGWLVLYGLAIVGLRAGWRRRDQLAYPVYVGAAVFLAAAVTQGNLGTAFRHRGQVLWVLCVLAAVGLQHLADRRRAAST